MLRTLRVSDLAIIDELELFFEPGLNVLTGETGAGKSVLLHALDVALGGRAEADLVRGGAEEGAVEALFADVPETTRLVLEAAGLPVGGTDELLIRRVIPRGGRTRTHVNGALASQALLQDLAPTLLRVYGQDEHQALRRVESHRELVDDVGGLASAVQEMRQRHARLGITRQAVADHKAERQAAAERIELIEFQVGELERAALAAGEEETLAAERLRLLHAEKLAALVGGAESGLYSGEGAAVDAIGRALAALREAERLDASLAPTRTLLETAMAEVQDVGATLGRYVRDLTPDAERLDAVEGRLAELARLKRKYGGAVGDLIARRDALRAELEGFGGGAETTAALEAECAAAERAAVEWAKRLSVERRRVARDLERTLTSELRSLAMEGARFAVRFAESDGRPVGAEGWDEIEFLLSANPGEELRPLSRVASGGELSRIMLALKCLAASEERGAALIFDEVDAGIGGAVAEVVARKLRQLGRRRQVLCVTHLPVVAAFAQHHIGVVKRVVEGRTVSTARPLATAERVAELARMLAGARVSREAEEHAQQLLRQAGVRATA
ncbi:MAG TPA: DNA repair protein RecN [Candidatus Binatia bacterium]|nr:DNA repair protein RecN [Candidatus Binatia bacterium]